MDETALEAQRAEVKSGVSKEHRTIKLRLEPDAASTSESIVGEVGSRLEARRGRNCQELGAVLLGHGDLRITEVLNMAGDGEEETEDEGPREVTVEGEFYLLKPPKVGQELICRGRS